MSTNTSPLPPVPHSGVQITLRVQYNTSFGQTLYVCGSPLALGAWDPAQALREVVHAGIGVADVRFVDANGTAEGSVWSTSTW